MPLNHHTSGSMQAEARTWPWPGYDQNIGAEAKISFEMALRSYYWGKLCHREVDLVETLPLPVFEKCMRDLAARFLASASTDDVVVGQPGKGTTPILKKRSVCVMLSSDEETKSDDFSLFPRKIRNMMFVPKLLGDIGYVLDSSACSMLGDILGVSGGYSPSNKPYMVDEVRNASHPLASEAYVPIWVVTKDSLLLEDIAAQE
ncbi:unnamed protein product [Lactuca saligna]|uniref:Uncharacterized protein n=1 Tax=Lactuca saligna TaxID=75948 RepID=A0AA35ZE49_LACSI|nr:unnamed protein product [Lactuca saligna]